MKEIKLFAFDIDGTILPHKALDIEESTKDAFRQLIKKGYKVLISTGRCSYFIPNCVLDNIESDFFITINGTLVTDGHFNSLKAIKISEDEFNALLTSAIKHDVAIGFKFEKAISIYHKYDEFCQSYISGKVNPNLLVDSTKDYKYHFDHGMPCGCYLIGDMEKLLKVKADTPFMEWVGSYADAIECTHKGTSKADGIRWVCDKLNINTDEVMAFGDNDNDVLMIQMAGIGVAMGNATEELKNTADYVTTDCGNNGIYNALKHFNYID